MRSSRAALEFEAVADDGVPRGVVCIDFNSSAGSADTAAALIDHAGASALIDVRDARRASVRLEKCAMPSLLGLGDPLFTHGVHWAQSSHRRHQGPGGLRGAVGVSVMLMIWFERKVISDMQARIGPNRAGPWGLLQTLADGIKLFFKEDLLPERADRTVFKLAPYLSMLPASSPSPSSRREAW